MKRKRICKECFAPINREQSRKSKAKRLGKLNKIIKENEVLYPEPDRLESLKGFSNLVFPKNYAGMRNL